MEDVARRRNRVAAVEQPQARLLRGGDQPQGERAVAGDVAVLARLEPGGLDRIRRQRLDGLAVVIAGLERAQVGFRQRRGLLEALPDGVLLAIGVARVDPEDEPQRVEVLAAAGVLRRDAGALHRLPHQVLEVDLDHPVVVERPVGERVRFPAGFFEVVFGERIGIEDQQAAFRQVAQIDFERGGVHHDERVRLISRRVHLVSGKLDLIPGDARGGARGGPDLRRIIRERRQVVAVQRGLAGELGAGELHAITGVARETHDGILDVDVRTRGGGFRHHFLLQGRTDEIVTRFGPVRRVPRLAGRTSLRDA